ncbi:unnamed protein product [Calicophoron daubneyi]|uniref:Uncharacterized protein n=1 Tax=Calicophoron daubneyi TaxID=300641 RepID=A0AAV2U1A3_CALDB
MSEKAPHLTSPYPAAPNPTESQPSAQEWQTGPPGTSEGDMAAGEDIPLQSIQSVPTEPPSTYEDGFLKLGFSEKSVRRGFIRKVFLLLAAQMVATVGIVCIFMFVTPFKIWIQQHAWFYYLSYAVFIVTYILFGCFSECRRRYPLNILCLVFFTLILSYLAGCIAAFHDTEAVLIAFALTVVMCLALCLFAVQTRIDFTTCSGLLFVLCLAFFLTGLACLIVYVVSGPSRVLDAVFGGLVLLVLGLMLVISMQEIVGGKSVEMSPEEYVYGAMQLYVNIIFMFMILVGLIGQR